MYQSMSDLFTYIYRFCVYIYTQIHVIVNSLIVYIYVDFVQEGTSNLVGSAYRALEPSRPGAVSGGIDPVFKRIFGLASLQ